MGLPLCKPPQTGVAGLATGRRSDNISPESRFLPDGAAIFKRRRAARSALFRFLQTAHAVIGGEIPPLSFPASVAALLVFAVVGWTIGVPARGVALCSTLRRAVRKTYQRFRTSMTTIVLKENEPFDVAIRRFRRTIEKNGLIAELRERQSYEKPTTARKRKKAAAVSRLRKRLRSQMLPKKLH
jgi:small subunit ribosomal protein S21